MMMMTSNKSEPNPDSYRDYRVKMQTLTPRQRQFLKYCCRDMRYADIAKEMGVGPRTVDGYRDALFKKLKVKTRAGLITYAIKYGIVKIKTLPKSEPDPDSYRVVNRKS